MNLETPVLFLIFNRPEEAIQVFAKIKEAQPKQLFIAADGPRNKVGEKEKCEAARKIILESIDWDCDVKTLFRTENLGCRRAVSGAINWFFEHVEMGIILEDDCVPDISFFYFCEALLIQYNTDKEIGSICGFNCQLGISRTKYSYFFARIFSPTGWATWADRWQKYNEITDTPEEDVLNNPVIIDWKNEIIKTFEGKIDSWAYRWQYTTRKNEFLCIYPDVNLITNIGFTNEATHTTNIRWFYKFIKYGSVSTIKHPPDKKICKDADRLITELNMAIPVNWADRIKYKWAILKTKFFIILILSVLLFRSLPTSCP